MLRTRDLGDVSLTDVLGVNTYPVHDEDGAWSGWANDVLRHLAAYVGHGAG